MGVDDFFGNGQSKPGTACIAGMGLSSRKNFSNIVSSFSRGIGSP